MHSRGYSVVNLEGTAPVELEHGNAHALALPPPGDGD
jgi:hypothetical protein